MTRPADLTEFARVGYDGNQNPHLFSSPAWYAHAVGVMLHRTGRTPPRDVRMGRGDSIRANDMRFSFKHDGKIVQFTREE